MSSTTQHVLITTKAAQAAATRAAAKISARGRAASAKPQRANKSAKKQSAVKKPVPARSSDSTVIAQPAALSSPIVSEPIHEEVRGEALTPEEQVLPAEHASDYAMDHWTEQPVEQTTLAAASVLSNEAWFEEQQQFSATPDSLPEYAAFEPQEPMERHDCHADEMIIPEAAPAKRISPAGRVLRTLALRWGGFLEFLTHGANTFLHRLAQGWNWLQERMKSQQSKKRLRVCESVSLGEKRFIAVIQVDGEQFLVGGSSTSVSTLAHLEQPRQFSEVFSSYEQSGMQA